MLGCHSGGRLLALLTTSMKLSLASTDFKAATNRADELLIIFQELDKELNCVMRSYAKIEQELVKFLSVQERVEKKWEDDNAAGNLAALKKLRRRMSVEEQNLSQDNILRLILLNVNDIVGMHPTTLEKMNTTGLTLTERRAIYEVLRPAGREWKSLQANEMMERKWAWYYKMKEDFKEYLLAWKLHVDQYGPPGAHPSATKENPCQGCPLIGNQFLTRGPLMDANQA